MKSRYALVSVLALLSTAAFATNPPKEPPKSDPPTTVTQTANPSSTSKSAAEARAAAAAAAAARAQATGGEARASADGEQTTIVDASSNYERQVPALIMGTVIPVDCGFGGQAGGANTNGAGFLGAAWTTDRCYTLKVANAWAAMGEYEFACEMLMDVSRRAVRRRNMRKVDCGLIGASLRASHTQSVVIQQAPKVEPVPAAPTAPPSDYVTREELRMYVDRAFRKGVSK